MSHVEAVWDTLLTKLPPILQANPRKEQIDNLFRQIAQVDQEVETAIQASVDSVWAKLLAPNKAGVSDASLKPLLSAQPPPRSQMFLEADLPSDKELLDAAQHASTEYVAREVVMFYLQSMFGQLSGPVDEKLLEHLERIGSQTVTQSPDGNPAFGFRLSFHFGEGARKYFRNPILSVTVLSSGSEHGSIFLSDTFDRVVGTTIEWVGDADPTIMKIEIPPEVPSSGATRKRGRDQKHEKGTKPAAPKYVTVKQDSFFRIFESFDVSASSAPDESGSTHDDDQSDAGDSEKDLEEKRQRQLIRHLTNYFLSAPFPMLLLKRMPPDPEEGLDDEDGGTPFGGGGDEDESFDGEFGGSGDDEDEEEEDDAPPQPPSKAAKKEGSSSSSGNAKGSGMPKQPECKQQ